MCWIVVFELTSLERSYSVLRISCGEVCSSVETGVAGELKSVLLVACQMLGARQIQHLWNTPALSAAKDLQMNGCCKGM